MRLLPLILLFCSITNGGTIDPKVPDEKYIEYGKKHPSVFRLSGKEKGGQQFFASCVLVKPKIIITAAHVASDIDRSYVIKNENETVDVIALIYPEQYKEREFVGQGFDIAVGILDERIVIDSYPDLYEKDDELNRECSISGFGMTGNFDTGVKISDGKKRAGLNTIEKIDVYGVLVCSANNPKQTSLEFLIAGGDSGGGLFIDNKLAGINSSIFTYGTSSPKADRNTYSAHTRISQHRAWLIKMIEELENANFSRATGNNGK